MSGRDPIAPLAACQSSGVVVAELVAIADDGRTPLVVDPQRPEAGAQPARTVVALHGAHVGRRVLLMFEGGDPGRPIVMGVLQDEGCLPVDGQPGQLELDTDGQSLVVSAKERLVLRCGKASITLTRAGKVLISGAYVLSQSTGVNRVKGGSVQLN